MNHHLQTLAAMTTPARYIDDVRWAHPWAALWQETSIELEHIVDSTPLPEPVPVTGEAPREALVRAVIDADLDALRVELAVEVTGLNDAIPGTEGKTLLHFASRLHGQAANGHSQRAQVRRLALEQITRALLEAGADPLAKDDHDIYPATYSHGNTPASLRDRMVRAARDGRFKCGNAIHWMPRRKRVA